MKYFFSLISVIFFFGNASAQVCRFAPTALKLGVDPGTLYYSIFSQKRDFLEFEADIDIDAFFLVVNYGLSDYNLNETTYNYSNTGRYFRFGFDFNFMRDDPHYNVAFVGLRYATSGFEDQLNFDTQAIIESETGWPNTTETFSNSNLNARWFEMNAGLKIRVVNQLFLGFTVRYKLFLQVTGVEDLRPYYVPGFGKNVSSAAFGFNYYVSYRLPFRKKTIYIKEK